jgi:hypothetical protein
MGNEQSKNPVLSTDRSHSSSSSASSTNSSLTRSRSQRAQANHRMLMEGTTMDAALAHGVNRLQLEQPRFLPRGLDKAHNGIRMPMPHYGTATEQQPVANTNSTDNGDGESPSWGWYIRTTPPTPEMYQAHSRNPSNASSTSSAMSKHSNPVFQNLQDKNKANPMGWSGVPL